MESMMMICMFQQYTCISSIRVLASVSECQRLQPYSYSYVLLSIYGPRVRYCCIASDGFKWLSTSGCLVEEVEAGYSASLSSTYALTHAFGGKHKHAQAWFSVLRLVCVCRKATSIRGLPDILFSSAR